MKKSTGFTLIELLVVISIISLLASTALASLNVARAKATDAKVKQTMSNMKTQISLYYDAHQSYVGINADPVIGSMINSATAATGGSGGVYSQIELENALGAWTPTEWIAWAELKYQQGYGICMDASGVSKIMEMSLIESYYACEF